MPVININTSVDDLRSSFKCTIEAYSVQDFDAALEEEKNGQNRITVIKLLNTAKGHRSRGALRI